MFLYGTKYIFRQKRTAIERKIGSKVECLKKHTYVYSKHNKNYTLYAISLDISIEKVNILMKHSRNMHYRLYAL